MQWLDVALIKPAWQQAVATPTNPSSLALALIGVAMLLLFSMRSRSKSQNRATDAKISQPATPPEKRRAA